MMKWMRNLSKILSRSDIPLNGSLLSRLRLVHTLCEEKEDVISQLEIASWVLRQDSVCLEFVVLLVSSGWTIQYALDRVLNAYLVDFLKDPQPNPIAEEQWDLFVRSCNVAFATGMKLTSKSCLRLACVEIDLSATLRHSQREDLKSMVMDKRVELARIPAEFRRIIAFIEKSVIDQAPTELPTLIPVPSSSKSERQSKSGARSAARSTARSRSCSSTDQTSRDRESAERNSERQNRTLRRSADRNGGRKERNSGRREGRSPRTERRKERSSERIESRRSLNRSERNEAKDSPRRVVYKDRNERDRNERDRNERDRNDRDRNDRDRNESDRNERDRNERDRNERDRNESDRNERDRNERDRNESKEFDQRGHYESQGLHSHNLHSIDSHLHFGRSPSSTPSRSIHRDTASYGSHHLPSTDCHGSTNQADANQRDPNQRDVNQRDVDQRDVDQGEPNQEQSFQGLQAEHMQQVFNNVNLRNLPASLAGSAHQLSALAEALYPFQPLHVPHDIYPLVRSSAALKWQRLEEGTFADEASGVMADPDEKELHDNKLSGDEKLIGGGKFVSSLFRPNPNAPVFVPASERSFV